MAVVTGIDERAVVGLWERQLIPAQALKTLGLRVIFRGLPSDAGGPDYQDAMVSVGNARAIAGDVEFHVQAGDWYRHGHHDNSRYNRVILHVVWTDDGIETRTQDGRSVPVLALEPFADLCPALRPADDRAALMPHRCIATFQAIETGKLWEEIRRLGAQRFQERASRFAADLTAVDADQLAYSALLEGMGYASNRQAFVRLSDAVRFSWLQSVPSNERLSTLLDAAGLGPPASFPPPAYLPAGSWRLSMLRPANHPARRLEGIVLLLDRLGSSPSASLVDLVAAVCRPAALRAALVVHGDEGALIGAGRADELAVSVVLPLVAALERQPGRAADLNARYPSPPANRWTRHMLSLLRAGGHDVTSVRSAREHQGLHHLYHGFCRSGNASQCSVCRLARMQSPASSSRMPMG